MEQKDPHVNEQRIESRLSLEQYRDIVLHVWDTIKRKKGDPKIGLANLLDHAQGAERDARHILDSWPALAMDESYDERLKEFFKDRQREHEDASEVVHFLQNPEDPRYLERMPESVKSFLKGACYQTRIEQEESQNICRRGLELRTTNYHDLSEKWREWKGIAAFIDRIALRYRQQDELDSEKLLIPASNFFAELESSLLQRKQTIKKEAGLQFPDLKDLSNGSEIVFSTLNSSYRFRMIEADQAKHGTLMEALDSVGKVRKGERYLVSYLYGSILCSPLSGGDDIITSHLKAVNYSK